MYNSTTNKICNRHTIRLQKYDYAQAGAYFITICTHQGQHTFAEIVDGKVKLSKLGITIEDYWSQVPKHYMQTSLDEYVVMPNHVHGIIRIHNDSDWARDSVRAQETETHPQLAPSTEPQHNKFQKIIPKSIGSIIRGFKASVTKWSRDNNLDYTVWHRNYYEHIVRDEDDLFRIKQYILNNPKRWAKNPGIHLYDPYRN